MPERFSAVTVSSYWQDVDSHRPLTREMKAFELELEVAGGKVLLGVGADGLRRILFPLGPGGPCDPDTRSAGVRIVRSELIDDELGRLQFVEVVCRRPQLNDLFSSISAEILNSVSENQARPDLRAGSVLNRWRNLLRAETSASLEANTVIGLMGELIVLEQIAETGNLNHEIWTGPDMSQHDFTMPGGSLEVKSTTAASGLRVEIHGTGQLELPASGRLMLVTVRLERSPEGDRNLSDQIERIVSLGFEEEEIWAKLNLINVYEEPAGRLMEHKFNFREISAFEVDTTFPRISDDLFSDGAIPKQIIDLSYTLDLTGMEHLTLERYESVLLDMAGA